MLAAGVFSLLLGVRPPAPVAAARVASGLPYSLLTAIPPSRYHVPGKIAATYYGRCALQTIDERSRLNDGSVYIERRDPNSMIGLVQFYGHDQSGLQTSWFEVLSDFHQVARGRMAIDLFNPVGQYIGDQLLVSRTASGDLVGQLLLDGKNYNIRWRKLVAR